MLPTIIASLFAVTSVLAAPTPSSDWVTRQNRPPAVPSTNTTVYTNAQILQLALYFENLENAFFQFTPQDYLDAGYPAYAPGRVQQAVELDLAQTKFLIDALGPENSNILPCEYDFSGLTTAEGYLREAAKLKQVVSSAYTGSLQYLETHGPFDSYLSLDGGYSFVQGYITSCPDNSIQLPFATFPTLTVNGGYGGTDGESGATVQLSYDGSDSQREPLFLTVANGLGQTPTSAAF